MGSEQARKRKHLFLCLAGSITISLAIHGCVHFQKKSEGEQHLATATALMNQGEFEESLRESQEVLGQYPQAHGDRALFQMGLIYLHPRNPKSDYQKALRYFQMLRRGFPGSDLRSEAEIWILVLRKIAEREKEIEALNEECKLRKRKISEKQKETNVLTHQVESLQNQTKSLQSQTGELEQQKKDLQQQIKQLKEIEKDLQEQIKQLKEIDLGIEEKRRDALQK